MIADFDTKKATTFNNIPGKFLKDYAESYSKTITGLVNESIETFNFSDKLKLADIHPIHKKESRNSAKNYRPVSVLPYASKLYERILKNRLILVWIAFSQTDYVVIEKVLMHSMHSFQ